MEADQRGAVEKFIDDQLSEGTLSNTVVIWRDQSSKGFTSAIEEAIYGYIVGVVVTFAAGLTGRRKSTRVVEGNVEVADEIFAIISRRGLEIKSRIREVANK